MWLFRWVKEIANAIFPSKLGSIMMTEQINVNNSTSIC